ERVLQRKISSASALRQGDGEPRFSVHCTALGGHHPGPALPSSCCSIAAPSLPRLSPGLPGEFRYLSQASPWQEGRLLDRRVLPPENTVEGLSDDQRWEHK
ncbi:hypothetical protein P7K49_012361, partial [Saguinus oedipus]